MDNEIQRFSIDEYAKAAPTMIPDLHRGGEVAWSERGFEILSARLNTELLTSPELDTPRAHDFRSSGATPLIQEFVDEGIFLFMERSRHDRIRKVFARAFAVKQIAQFSGVIDEVAQRLVADLIGNGGGDLGADYALRVAPEALCRFLGVPVRDLPEFLDAAVYLFHIVDTPLAPFVDGLDAALNVLGPYAESLIRLRREDPRDDFVSRLVANEHDDGALSGKELVWGVANLFLAGIHTTSSQLTAVLCLMLENDLWERVAHEPDLVEPVIRESMRLLPVSTALRRITVGEMHLAGATLPAGTSVILNMLAAGRDPSAYRNPDRFELGRAVDMMSFGGGHHRCIGERFARSEMTVAVRAIVQATTDVAVVGDPLMQPWTELGGVESVRVALRARSS